MKCLTLFSQRNPLMPELYSGRREASVYHGARNNVILNFYCVVIVFKTANCQPDKIILTVQPRLIGRTRKVNFNPYLCSTNPARSPGIFFTTNLLPL